jgi:type IX secretion system substrate protein
MKKRYLLLSFVIICALGIISTTTVNSHIVFAPAGFCGDPTSATSQVTLPGIAGYQTCVNSGCHGGNPQAVTAQNLSILIGTDSPAVTPLDNTFKYIPNQTYFISFAVLAPGYVWGFEMTALNPDTTMAGSFTRDNTLTEHLSIPSLNAPTYITHLHANPATSSWSFKWTAPATDSAVTFYYAFNAGDSADFANDIPDANIFATTVTVLAQNVGIENIANNISGLQVYPNPIDGAFSLSFDVLKPGNASASIYSVDGKFCRQLFNDNLSTGAFTHNYNIASLAAGIYLVKMNMGGATITKKIVKE